MFDLNEFKQSLSDFSVEQLKECLDKLNIDLTHMIADENLIEKIAIVTAVLEEKCNG